MENTEEQRLEEQKQIIASMRNAQKNMQQALNRITALEGALKSAANSIDDLKRYLPEHGYTYRGEKKIRSLADDYAKSARELL